MYAGNHTESQIRREIGYSPDVFKRILAEANVSKRIKLNISHPTALYSCNETFFDNPEAWGEKQAYWLGWLYSDGYNSGKQFGIRIQASDKHILEDLRKAIEYTGPIQVRKRKPESIFGGPIKQYQDRAILNITNKKICAKLTRLGIVRSKATDSPFPEYLRVDLYPHFIRGLYDGDGTFCFTRHGKFETNLLANESMLKKIQSIYDSMDMYGYISMGGSFQNGVRTHRLCGNEKGIRLFNYLYENATLYLKRKVQPFIKLRNHKKKTVLVHKSMKGHCDKFYRLINKFE